jgi:zinc protease
VPPTDVDYRLDRRQLDNGLRVFVNEDHTAPVAAVNLWYGVGSRHEPPGRTGFAHLFEHLMFEGSQHVAKGEHFRLVHAAGGTLNATTSWDRTNYFETLPSNHLELALWLEADRMGGLEEALDDHVVDVQRAVVKNERRQRIDNQPYGTWLEKIAALAFPDGHPYQHPIVGSMEDLDAATVADVAAFHRAHYGPDNAVLTVVGDVEPEQVFGWAETYFAPIPPRAGAAPAPDMSLREPIPAGAATTVPDDVPTAGLFIAYRCPPYGTDEFETATVLTAVLGVGNGSRLHRRLVHDRQIAQPFDDGFADRLPLVGDTGLLLLHVLGRDGVPVETLLTAVDEVLAEVRTGVGAEDVDRGRALLAAEWLRQVASLDGRADVVSEHALLFGDPEQVNHRLGRLARVTPAQVSAAAEQLLGADRAVVTYVPDGAAG